MHATENSPKYLRARDVKTDAQIREFLLADTADGFEGLTVIAVIKHITWRAIFLASYNNSLLASDIADNLSSAIGSYRASRRRSARS